MEDYRLDAPCGLYCGACGTVLADRRGTVEDLAREWEMDPEQLVCHGCHSGTTAVFCRDCRLRSCASSRGVEHCSECGDFPCGDLVAFCNDEAPHHSVVLANLRRMQEVGKAAWLEEQRTRWSCPGCGEPFFWYDTSCRFCGTAVRDCRAEEAELRSGGK